MHVHAARQPAAAPSMHSHLLENKFDSPPKNSYAFAKSTNQREPERAPMVQGSWATDALICALLMCAHSWAHVVRSVLWRVELWRVELCVRRLVQPCTCSCACTQSILSALSSNFLFMACAPVHVLMCNRCMTAARVTRRARRRPSVEFSQSFARRGGRSALRTHAAHTLSTCRW